MAKKLTGITTQYHTFVDNQVLTEDQLNGFIEYFEDQHRLTRTLLHGVGIVCGFKLRFDNAEKTLTISQGAGVTTDGDLVFLRENIPLSTEKSIDLKEVKYTHFRKFEDTSANYSFFKTGGDGTNGTPMDLWEILPGKTGNEAPLSNMTGLANKVALLYLEAYPKQGDLCTTIDCDNQGVEQVARLRVLLVSKENAEVIAQNDKLFSKYDVADKYQELPDIAVPRVILNPGNTSDYENLRLAFYSAISNTAFLNTLQTGIQKIFDDFNGILNLPSVNLSSLLHELKKIAGQVKYLIPVDIQYRYDCIKDVVETYMEIKSLLTGLVQECCPSIHAFPKHLLLGSLDETESPVKHFRHRFLKSPASACGTGKLEQCRSLVWRLIRIITKFSIQSGEIKITPSGMKVLAGERAIPFYYNVDNELLDAWNYFKTEKNAQKTNLSYHRENLAGLPHIQSPLKYNIDGFDFYRIEGHQGKNFSSVLEEIIRQRDQYGLAFDVKALSVNLNTQNLNIDDYECEFEDLKVLLNAWTTEQECILAQVSSFFSGFSLVEPGSNVKDPVLTHRVKAKDISVGEAVVPNRLKAVSGIAMKSGGVLAARGSLVTGKAGTENLAEQPILAYISTTIPDNLTTEKDSLGSVLITAYEESKGGSVNDVIAKSKTLVEAQLSEEIWAGQADKKSFVIDQSIELLAWSNELVQKTPGRIQDFTGTQVDKYKFTLQELCTRVKIFKNRYQSIELAQSLKLFMDLIINQLSLVCCSGKKLEVLYEEINARKESILARLQLAKFIEKHPGLEHKAGVQPGGTFVLVYLNKSQQGLNVRERVDLDSSELRTARTDKASAKETAEKVSVLENYREILKKENRSREEVLILDREIDASRAVLFEKIVTDSEIPNNTVIADFSLPYLCCSDCAPVNFIIPKPPARLRLEKDKHCIGSDSNVILYEVTPSDGVIAANPETKGLAFGDGKITIDPAVFPEEMLGHTIHFTVNQQVTDAELTVYKAPQIDFGAPEKLAIGQEFTFIPTGVPEKASMLWDFGDGTTSAEEKPVHSYKKLPGTQDNIVVVKLVVTGFNRICTSTAEHPIQLYETVIEVNLPKKDFCENDKQEVPFIIKPEGAEVVIKGNGVEKLADGGFVFVPAKAGVGTHEFTVNGKPSGIAATVHARPVVAFEPKQEDKWLILTNNSTGAKGFVWTVNNEKIEREDLSPVKIELNAESPTAWKISLEAKSEFCGTVKSRVVNFTTTPVGQPDNNCFDLAKARITEDLKVLQTLNLPGSNFVGLIWQSTSELYGGTDQFKNGVLNDLEKFLKGEHNKRLPELFTRLWTQTSRMIIELSGNPASKEFQVVVQLFALQLQLFYNVLGCQGNEVLAASAEILKSLLEGILSILRNFAERKIILPGSFQKFLEEYLKRVDGKPLLVDHLKEIQKLVQV